MNPNETNMRRQTWNPFSSTSPYHPSARLDRHGHQYKPRKSLRHLHPQDTPTGLSLGNSDPFIQDQDEEPTRELHLDGRRKPWWKRIGSNVSKLLDAFNENLLYDSGDGFPYPFQGKVRMWKQNRRDKKERQRQGGS